jgi:hypothetical protein
VIVIQQIFAIIFVFGNRQHNYKNKKTRQATQHYFKNKNGFFKRISAIRKIIKKKNQNYKQKYVFFKQKNPGRRSAIPELKVLKKAR